MTPERNFDPQCLISRPLSLAIAKRAEELATQHQTDWVDLADVRETLPDLGKVMLLNGRVVSSSLVRDTGTQTVQAEQATPGIHPDAQQPH